MLLQISRNFEQWARRDEHLANLTSQVHNTFQDASPALLIGLKQIGLTTDQIISILGELAPYYFSGYAQFNSIRYLSWEWPNGDKVLYPINSRNEIYIGTDHPIWAHQWPFLTSSTTGFYNCILPDYTNRAPIQHNSPPLLWLGGQSHYGHFIVNFLAPLVRSVDLCPSFPRFTNILVPRGYTPLHRQLLTAFLGGESWSFREDCIHNGIYTLNNVIVPSFPENLDSVYRLQGRLESAHQNRQINYRKKIYITRSTDFLSSDRLVNYSAFLAQLRSSGFTIVNMVKLDLEARLNILGDARLIVTDSGSCDVNAYIYGNKESVIRSLIPARVLASTNPYELNMLTPMLAPLSKGNYVPILTHKSSPTNGFYDICIPPALELLIS
jgi:hypothetical protein